jgi:tetratricopeptide (TPR) repeat protein
MPVSLHMVLPEDHWGEPMERASERDGYPVSPPERADWLVAGRQRRDRGQLSQALGWFGMVRDLGRRPRALCEIGAIHRMRGDLDRAIWSYQMAVAACRRDPAGDPSLGREARRALAELGEARERRLTEGETLADALARHRESGDQAAEAMVRSQLVLHHQQLGELDEALAHGEQAIGLYRRLGDLRAHAVAVGNLGTLKYEVGRWQRASSLYQEATALHQQVGNLRAEGGVASNLAHLLHQSEHHDAAAGWYRHAISLHERAQQPARQARTLVHLAELERHRGHPQDAELWLEEAAALLRRLDDPRLEASWMGQQAAGLAATDPQGAEELFDRATALLCGSPDPIGLGWLLLTRAEVALEQGRASRAHELLDELPQLVPRPGAPLDNRSRQLRARSEK